MDRKASALGMLGQGGQVGQGFANPDWWQGLTQAGQVETTGILVVRGALKPKRLKPRGTWKKLRRCK